jgi:hypothetical protein
MAMDYPLFAHYGIIILIKPLLKIKNYFSSSPRREYQRQPIPADNGPGMANGQARARS